MLLSIITPSFNRADFIETAIKSVIKQNYNHVEHIIIDGQSTDNTAEIVKQYPHIKLISEPDEGLYDALNKGIKIAKGDIIGFLNTDDKYFPNIFASVIQSFTNNTQIVCGGAQVIDHQSQQILNTFANHPYNTMKLKHLIAHAPIINAKFFRKSIFDQFGYFDIRYPIISDLELLSRFAMQSINYKSINDLIYCYQHHSNSLTLNDDYMNQLDNLINKLSIPEYYLSKQPLTYQQRRLYRWWHSYDINQSIKLAIKQRNYSFILKQIPRALHYNLFWPTAVVRDLYKSILC